MLLKCGLVLGLSALAAGLRLAPEAVYQNGSDCVMQHTLQPLRQRHGFPQRGNTPIQFAVLDSNYQPVETYRPGNVYTIEIQSQLEIRGFLIQPRLATKEGFIIGHLRGGHFRPDRSWESYGIKFQECVTNFNNSITHANWEPKRIVRASWTADRVLGPVQFFLTVYHMREVYWERIQPISGFLRPDPKYNASAAARSSYSALANQAPPPEYQLVEQPSSLSAGESVPQFKLSDEEGTEALEEPKPLTVDALNLVPEGEPEPAPEANAEPEPVGEVVAEPEPAGEVIAEPEPAAEAKPLGLTLEDLKDSSEAASEPEPAPEGEAVAEPEPLAKEASEPSARALQYAAEKEALELLDFQAKPKESKDAELLVEEPKAEPEAEPEPKPESAVEESIAAAIEAKKLLEASSLSHLQGPQIKLFSNSPGIAEVARQWSSRSLLRRRPVGMKEAKEVNEPAQPPKLQPIGPLLAAPKEPVPVPEEPVPVPEESAVPVPVPEELEESLEKSNETSVEEESSEEPLPAFSAEELEAPTTPVPTQAPLTEGYVPWVEGDVKDFAAELLGVPVEGLSLDRFQSEDERQAAFKLTHANFEEVLAKDENRDYCNPQPCYSGGTCEPREEADEEGRFYNCTCPDGWRGPRCERRDYCADKPCAMGVCSNDDRHHTFNCECFDHFVGKTCEHPCPYGYCGYDGKCGWDEDSGNLTCKCAPGRAGDRCGEEVNECEPNPCFNGGFCTDLLGSYVCTCQHGFMGPRCHRPCQDIYAECGNWTTAARCGNPYEEEEGDRFIKDNCALSCNHCSQDEDNVEESPLAPVLEPLAWLVGRWETESRNGVLHPLDLGDAYNETLYVDFDRQPSHGVESLTFISEANTAAGEKARSEGFLTLEKREGEKLYTASLITKGKDGSLVVEEAPVERWRLILTPKLKKPAVFPLPIELSRELELTGSYLRETIAKKFADGDRTFATKYYYKRHPDDIIE